MYRSVIFALSILAIMAINPAISGGGPAPAPTATIEGCKSGYNSSNASSTCPLTGARVEDRKCNIYARCTYQTTTGDDRGDAHITGVSEGDTSRINHCGGVTLKVGSC